MDDLIDADSNQGIGYARDDVDGDSTMWMTLLDIIIVIMAFVFVVLTDATIEEESASSARCSPAAIVVARLCCTTWRFPPS